MKGPREALIAATKQRITIHRTVIATIVRRGGDASRYKAELAAEERFLANECAPPGPPETPSSAEGTAVGYIMPPGAI
jgi:hypothetical protein